MRTLKSLDEVVGMVFYMVRERATKRWMGAGLTSDKPPKIWNSTGSVRRAITRCSWATGEEPEEFRKLYDIVKVRITEEAVLPPVRGKELV